MKKPTTVAVLGCGSRSRQYAELLAKQPELWTLAAAADPIPEKIEAIRKLADDPEQFQTFSTGQELLDAGKLADVLIIGTQDSYHYEPAKQALALGYHLLLEKPACQSTEQTQEIADLAQKYDRKVVLCFVLRYTPTYKTIKSIVDSGKLGQIISIRATEGVGTWHQAHSFVRGHWARSEDSTPMILQKCSHDCDIISWLMNQPCKRVSSFGSLSFFRPENRTPGSPDNSFDVETDPCPYSAQRYTEGDNIRWLKMVYPDPENMEDTDKVIEWLKHSPWSRNAFGCDNNVPDHQVVNMEFENGATAALTMTAFDYGRTIEIYGTKASLRSGDAVKLHYEKDIVIRHHLSGAIEELPIEKGSNEGYQGHGGGDYGLIQDLHDLIHGDSKAGCIQDTIQGHLIAFAAEESRLNGGMPVQIS